jgi:hypothetical protein
MGALEPEDNGGRGPKYLGTYILVYAEVQAGQVLKGE